MLFLLIFLAFVIPSFYLIVLLGVKKSFYQTNNQSLERPFVSIIIAARNEELNIQKLCESLSHLNYPTADYEILIADDDSVDDTLRLLKQWKPVNAQIIPMSKNLTGQYGKIHAMRKLTAIATGEFLLFTDADMTFPENWVQSMIYPVSSQPEMMIGLTRVKSETMFGALQDLDWRLNSLLISWTNHYVGAVTAWGNNMMIDRQSYEQIGGYFGVEDTIVEDVVLMNKLVSKGGKVLIQADASAMAVTTSIMDFNTLISQRIRWMKVSNDKTWLMYLALLIRLLYLPVIFLLTLNSIWWLLMIPMKALVSLVLIRQSQTYSSITKQFGHLLVFEFYEFVVYLITFVNSLLSNQLDWKGRKYDFR